MSFQNARANRKKQPRKSKQPAKKKPPDAIVKKNSRSKVRAVDTRGTKVVKFPNGVQRPLGWTVSLSNYLTARDSFVEFRQIFALDGTRAEYIPSNPLFWGSRMLNIARRYAEYELMEFKIVFMPRYTDYDPVNYVLSTATLQHCKAFMRNANAFDVMRSMNSCVFPTSQPRIYEPPFVKKKYPVIPREPEDIAAVVVADVNDGNKNVADACMVMVEAKLRFCTTVNVRAVEDASADAEYVFSSSGVKAHKKDLMDAVGIIINVGGAFSDLQEGELILIPSVAVAAYSKATVLHNNVAVDYAGGADTVVHVRAIFLN